MGKGCVLKGGGIAQLVQCQTKRLGAILKQVLFPGVTIRDFAARVPEFLTMSVDY